MTRQVDVAIIGAGIVGTACAACLSRDGHRVLVLEQHTVGGGATAAGMGHVVVMDDSPAQLALTAYSRRLWRQLVSRLSPQAQCDPCGTMWIAADDQEMAAVDHKQKLLADYEVPAEILGAKQLAEAEPQLRTGLAGALRVPDDLVVYPPVVARHLLDEALARGAELWMPAQVVGIEGGSLLVDAQRRVDAHVVLIATGSWARQLVGPLPIRPRKGHLAITDRYGGFVHHQLIELGYLRSAHAMESQSVAFNIQPRKTGQLLIGSSRQLDAEDARVELDILRGMLRRAVGYLPGLAGLSVTRVWTGQRAATPDKLPLIGPLGNDSPVWLATGHEGLGIATSLATAELVADQLAGRSTAIPTAPYLPARFPSGEQVE